MNKPASSGFTLIEMMIALAIFASLIGLLTQGYSQGLSLWKRRLDVVNEWQSLEYRHGLLSSLFSQAQTSDYEEYKGKHVPFFEGDEHHLALISRSPIMDFQGRIRPVELKFERRVDESYNLVYREAPRYQDPDRGIEWGKSQSVVLIEKIKSGSFLFEAPAFPLPEELENLLDRTERQRYRDRPEWMSRFDSRFMWRVPQRVVVRFVDENAIDHQWTYFLPDAADAWSMDNFATE